MVTETINLGFRQTEVGMIPDDWEVKKLGDVTISIVSGKSNTSSEIGNYPIYGSTGIIGYKNHDDYHGDKILVARVGANAGTVNKVNGRYCVSDNTLMITYPTDIDIDFAYYQLVNYKLNRIIFGSGQPLITGSQLKNVKLPFPHTKSEQSAIALRLSETDDFIKSLDRLIERKKNIKQGAMQELLTGKKRLPRFHDKWETKEIETFADVTAGGTPSTFVPEYWNGKIKWMNSGELNSKKIYDVEGRITELGLENSSTRLLPSKCVLIGLAGQGKTRGTAAINYVELCTNQSIGAILPNDSFVPEYLYHNLDSRYNELRRLSTGEGGRGGLNLTILRNILVTIPPTKEEQSAIAQVLSDMDSEIEDLEQKRDKYKQIKIGMMQQLLTGRIRLKWKS